VEIWQNCPVFNDEAFDAAAGREVRDDALIKLEHGKPLVFGKAKDKCIRPGKGFTLEAAPNGGDALVHDEAMGSPTLAMALANLEPPLPQVMGVLRAVQAPTCDELALEQEKWAAAQPGPKDLEALLNSGDTWSVGA
jgi:2-oxoglutarate ferredoxin oxidoreductase subunit beta